MGTSESFTGRFLHSVASLAALILCAPPAHAQVPTTLENFFHPGTQPDTSNGKNFDPFISAENCRFCHEVYDPVEYPIYTRWQGSMKANAARDPLFQAALAIADRDMASSGDLCIRCHAPNGWLGGRSTPTDGSALVGADFEGVNCNFCHRMADPEFKAGVSPPRDELILDALASAGLLPLQPGNSGYVVDPDDVRRGPFDPNDPEKPILNLHGVDIVLSPFHTKSDQCATCHDLSNPAYVRQPDGSYTLNTFGVEHPTLDKFDMFPMERTYSEWANSTYATIGVDAGGVFGGNHPTGVMRSCQDCHMPDTQAFGCAFDFEPYAYERANVPAHDFNGGNAWMQDVLLSLYPGELQPEYLADSQDRAIYMLQHASSLDVKLEACAIKVRIINETGHKLPTGYPEGRRMWINVEFRDSLNVLAERGEYASATAELTTSDTKVYEATLGLDAATAKLAGLLEGPSFHFALNNKIYKDNRIPPRGFSNATFAAVQAAPVGALYAEGQYWDDTLFRVPPGATKAAVSVYYQTASKEYITFLRDEILRDENLPDVIGNTLYEQWELTGKSPPVLMNERIVTGLIPGEFADADCNGRIDLDDWRLLGDCVTGPARTLNLGCEALDADLDGDVDLEDIGALQREFDPTE